MMRLAGLMMLGVTLGAGAQTIGSNTAADGNTTYTMSVKSQLVVEAVSVKDKQGNPIAGLKAKDFVLTEDGAVQTIKFLDYQELPGALPPIGPAEKGKEDVKIYKQLAKTQIAPEAPGQTRYKDRRLLALYFDMSSMPPQDQIRSLESAEKFVRTQITAADRVALLRYDSGSVEVLQDFTDDRNRLLSVLETLAVGEGQGNDEDPGDAGSADTGAAFGQDSGEFNIFNTDRQLAALQTASKMLGNLNEKKSLIYFASGMRLNGMNNQAQLHATIDAAIRAGVSIWAIDARGLVAEAPLGDASKGSPGNAGMYTGAASLAQAGNFAQSQDTMYALANDTGGKALLDNNDLGKGIVQAQQSVTSYYILGYYTTNPTLDGKFRKIKVTVAQPQDAKLDYRLGYYAGKVFAKFTAVDKERQLEDALMLNDPITELTIAMEINYFQMNRAEYFVPIVVKIPGRELALAKKGGAEHTVIDFVGEIKDNFGGTTITNIHDKVDIKLTDATAQELAKRPIEYDTGFTLLPGKYTIKFLARDDETGRIGTYQSTFVVPNLNKETQKVALSSVVLSAQLIASQDALFNAQKTKDAAKAEAVDPLVQGGKKLVPSVTRVFSQGRNLYVYLQAYEQGVTVAQPLVAYVTFFQEGKKVYETTAIEAPAVVGSRLNMVPMNFSIGLDKLVPGKYEVQVTVVNPVGEKVGFWSGVMAVVP